VNNYVTFHKQSQLVSAEQDIVILEPNRHQY